MAGGSVEFAASVIDSSNADQSLDEMLIVLVFVSTSFCKLNEIVLKIVFRLIV